MNDCKKCKELRENIEELRIELIEEGKIIGTITERLWMITHKK